MGKVHILLFLDRSTSQEYLPPSNRHVETDPVLLQDPQNGSTICTRKIAAGPPGPHYKGYLL